VEIGELTNLKNSKSIGERIYCSSRKQANTQIQDGSDPRRISIPVHLGNAFAVFFQDLGAETLLPSNGNDKVSYINRLHKALTINNKLCPPEIDFNVIYSQFFNAVLSGEIQPKGYSIKPLCDAFNQWITNDKVRNRLYEKHYEYNPDDKPKQLEESIPKPSFGLDVKEYVNQSPEDVKNQIDVLNDIHDGINSYIKSLPNGNGYYQRLLNTYNYYKEKGKIK